MVKYDLAFKLKTVEAYLAGEGGYLTIAKKYDVPSESNIRKWVRIYLKYGKKGLERKSNNKKYPVQFKLDVIEYKLRTGDSFNNIALHFDIPEPSLILSWYKVWQCKGKHTLSTPKRRLSMTKKERNRTSPFRECVLKKAPSFRDKYSEPTAKVETRIIHSLRSEFKLAVILEATGFPRSMYMYWQKRFNENNPDEEIEGLIKKIFEEHKGNYGYRRIGTELRNRGYMVNSKKILRIMRKLNLKCIKFTRKSRKFSTYKGTIGKVAKNLINRRFNTKIPLQKITT